MLLNRIETRRRENFFPPCSLRFALGALLAIATIAAVTLPRAAVAENPHIYRVASEGREMAYAAAVDAEGNFYIGGQFEGDATSSFGVAKFHPDGELLWRRRYGGSQGGQQGWVQHLAIDSHANVIATGGIATDEHTNDALTVKFASNGAELWAQREIGKASSAGARVAIDSTGNIYVGGSTTRISVDWLLLKYDRSGKLLWRRAMDGAARGNDYIVDLQATANGGVAVAGFNEYQMPGIGLQAAIVKLDADGTEQWRRTYLAAGHRDSLPLDMTIDSRDAVLITGLTSPNVRSGRAASVPFAIKLNAAGRLQLELNGPAAGGAAVLTDRLDQIVLAGAISRDSEDKSLAGPIVSTVSKYDSQGNQLWTTSLGAAGTFDVARAALAESGALFVAGTYSKRRGSDSIVRKLGEDGNTLWEYRYNPNGVGADTVIDLVVAPNGDAAVLGSSKRGKITDPVLLMFNALTAPAVVSGARTQ